MPIRKGFIPQGCVADGSSQGHSWYDSRIKTSPLHPITWIKSSSSRKRAGLRDAWRTRGWAQGVCPQSPPHPVERPEDWIWAPHKGQPLSDSPRMSVCPRGRLDPLEGVRWESRAPITKKWIWDSVSPPLSTPCRSGCVSLVWPVGGRIGDTVVPYNLCYPGLNPLWLWMDYTSLVFIQTSLPIAVGYNCHLYVCVLAAGYLWNTECWGHVTCTHKKNPQWSWPSGRHSSPVSLFPPPVERLTGIFGEMLWFIVPQRPIQISLSKSPWKYCSHLWTVSVFQTEQA